MKPIKSRAIGLVLSALLIMNSSYGYTGELETKVAESMANEYIKQQIKGRIADHLNKHPELVFSKNPKIGTEAFKLLGDVMSLYGLVNAKTDNDRLWSASNLLISPEPTTALILVAVQLMDTMLSLKAQLRLASIYAQTAKEIADTANIQKKTLTAKIERQSFLLTDFTQRNDQIQGLLGQINAHPLTLYLNGEEALPPPAPAPEITQLFTLIAELESHLNHLSQTERLIQILTADPQVSVPKELPKKIRDINVSYDDLRLHLVELNTRIQYIMLTQDQERLKERIKDQLKPHATTLALYRNCVNVVNTLAHTDYWSEKKSQESSEEDSDVEINSFVSDCQTRFPNIKDRL